MPYCDSSKGMCKKTADALQAGCWQSRQWAMGGGLGGPVEENRARKWFLKCLAIADL